MSPREKWIECPKYGGKQICEACDCENSAEYRASRAIPIAKPKRGRPLKLVEEPHIVERKQDIIQMRLDGATLNDIAVKYKITRERVRQIIAKIGREDIAGWEAPRHVKRRENHLEKLKRVCDTCGKEYFVKYSLRARKRGTYCSRDCLWNRPEWRQRAALIMAYRQNGVSWHDINPLIWPGINNTPTSNPAARFLQSWAEATGTDISHIIGYHPHLRAKRKKT